MVDRDTGVIWLPMTRDNDDVLLVSSKDEGQTWSAPRVITGSVKKDNWTWYGTGPGNGIQMTRGPHRGRLIIPCDHRIRSIADRSKSTRSHVIYSDDHGLTWSIGGITDFLMNECAVAEREDGSLLLTCEAIAAAIDAACPGARTAASTGAIVSTIRLWSSPFARPA